MARVSLVLPALLVALPLWAGCPSSSQKADADGGVDAGPIGPMPIPADSLCAEFADEYCTGNERCCGRPDEVYGMFTECAREQRLLCQSPTVGFAYTAEVGREEILYNQGRMGAALERVVDAVMACRPIHFGDEILNGIMGTVDEGGACVWLSCRDGLACIGGRCAPQPAEGSPCALDDDCGALRCRTDGTCQLLGDAGAACDVDGDCLSRSCAAGRCEPFTADNAYCVRLGSPPRPFSR